MTPTRVVCAVDGSPQAQRALTLAVDEAELRKVPLSVVIARPTLSARWAGDARLAAPLDSEHIEELRSTAAAMVETAVRERGAPLSSELIVEVLNGPPAEVIEEHLETSDMLFVGSRGLGGVRRLLLGSVSGALVQTAPCPVVVVRAPA